MKKLQTVEGRRGIMSGNTALPRKNYLDNIRSATIVLVLIYCFQSAGAASGIL